MEKEKNLKPTIYNWFLTHRLLKRINRNVQQFGFAEAFSRIIKSVSKKMEVQRPADSSRTLLEDPVLLITNHPADMDALVLLSSMPKRKDIYMLINNIFLTVLPAFDPHCIPVYLSYRFDGERKEPFRSKLFRRIHKYSVYSLDESQSKNKESIDTAAQIIHQGGVVLLAPGHANEDREFKIGLGHLLNALPNPEKVKILMTHISGTSHYDYFRIIPLLKYLLPKFRIVYSQPASAADFVSGDVKNDTLSLQEYYFNWAKNLVLNEDTILN